jgi:hypothetical protein
MVTWNQLNDHKAGALIRFMLLGLERMLAKTLTTSFVGAMLSESEALKHIIRRKLTGVRAMKYI